MYIYIYTLISQTQHDIHAFQLKSLSLSLGIIFELPRLIMENTEQKTLMKELSQGKELARQLMKQLQEEACSQEEKDFLVAEILCSYEKALSMLNHANHMGSESPQHYSSGNASPRSVFFDQETTAPKQALKKRYNESHESRLTSCMRFLLLISDLFVSVFVGKQCLNRARK